MSPSVWDGVDWSTSTSALAAERGVSISTVSKARRRYAPETLGAYSTRAPAEPVTELQKRHKAATARADVLARELAQTRKQLAVARRAFETAHALLTPVLEERDAALAQLAAAAGQRQPPPEPPADRPKPPAGARADRPTPPAEPHKLPTPAGTTWQPVTGPDAPPPPATEPRRRGPRSPRTEQALAEALDLHPDFAVALAGKLVETWHNPGPASGVDGTHNHP